MSYDIDLSVPILRIIAVHVYVSDRMLRRDPTRIELKLIDIEKEYEMMKKEKEQEQKNKILTELPSSMDTPSTFRSKTEMIHERIGYDPKPKPQPSSKRPIFD